MTKLNSLEINKNSIKIEGIAKNDFPDFTDAYISSAEYTNGILLYDKELEQLTDENPDLVNQLAIEQSI